MNRLVRFQSGIRPTYEPASFQVHISSGEPSDYAACENVMLGHDLSTNVRGARSWIAPVKVLLDYLTQHSILPQISPYAHHGWRGAPSPCVQQCQEHCIPRCVIPDNILAMGRVAIILLPHFRKCSRLKTLVQIRNLKSQHNCSSLMPSAHP